MESSRIGRDACGLSRQWRISFALAGMLVALDTRAAQIFSAQGLRWPGLWIISGYRSPTLQAQVNPRQPASRHRECPALAADLRVGDFPASTTPEYWRLLGTLWKAQGGRWGGDFPTPDLNHFEVLTVSGGFVASAPAFSRLLTKGGELTVTPTAPRVPRALIPGKRELRDLAPGIPIITVDPRGRRVSRRPAL